MLDADVREMLEAGASRGAGRTGSRRCRVVGRGRRDGLGLGLGGEVEEMPLIGIVDPAFAPRAEEVAAEQGQRLEQLGVFLPESVVVGGGGVEDAFQLVEPAANVLGSLAFALGALMCVLGLLPQRVVAAEQVREEPPALGRIIG